MDYRRSVPRWEPPTPIIFMCPGDEVAEEEWEVFINLAVWDKLILTDSGGFQVFSLAGLRKIKEEGVKFNPTSTAERSSWDPKRVCRFSLTWPPRSRWLDECPPSTASRDYIQNSVERTYRWLVRCKNEMARLNSLPDTINPHQMLFGINQGGIYEDIRIENAKEIAKLDLDGYAVGGLAVGESHEEMYRILDEVVPYLPLEKPVSIS